jgi:hypothetical protein
MNLRQFSEFIGATVLMAVATWFIAWWAVPLIAATWGLARRRDRWVPLLAGTAGMMSWLALLFLPSSPAAVGRLADVAGTAMGTGPGPLLVLTLMFPALLAASAASFARVISSASRPSS